MSFPMPEAWMAAINNARRTPTASAANKKALLKEARAMKAEATALLKTASKANAQGGKTHSLLDATFFLVQEVYGQHSDLEAPFYAVFASLMTLYLQLEEQLCWSDVTDPYCLGNLCFLFVTIAVEPFSLDSS